MTISGYSNMKVFILSLLFIPLLGLQVQGTSEHQHASNSRGKRSFSRRSGAKGDPYIISTIFNKPFLMQKPQTNKDTKHDLLYGFVPDLAGYLAAKLNFTYILEPTDKYGAKLENGSWNGMIGRVLEGEADFAIADLTITAARQRVVDFSTPFMTSGIGIIMGKEGSTTNMSPWVFLTPFSSGVWTSAFIAFIGLSVGLFVIGRFNAAEWIIDEQLGVARRVNRFSISNTLFFMSGSLTGQSTQIAPKGISTRLLSLTWWIFCFFAASMYIANLAAILVHNMDIVTYGPKIQSVEDLAAQTGVKYGTLSSGSTFSFFENSAVPLYQRLFSTMESFGPSAFVNTYAEGIEKVRQGSFAMFMEATSIEFQTESDCELVQVGGLLDYKGYGVVMRQGSRKRSLFNDAILEAQDKGLLRKIKDKWFKPETPLVCATEEPVNARGSLMMVNFGGIFTILGGGIVLSMIAGFLEMFWRAYSSSKQQGGSVSAELKREARYAIFGGVAPKKDTNNTADDVVLQRQDN